MADESTAAASTPQNQVEQKEREQAPGEGKAIQNLGVLDLTGMKSADELSSIARIENVGVILVSESLLGGLNSIPMKNVGATVPIPEGENVRVMTGNVRLSGEALANPAVSGDTLVVAGVMHVTTPIEKVAYKRLIVVGVVIAQRQRGCHGSRHQPPDRDRSLLRWHPSGLCRRRELFEGFPGPPRRPDHASAGWLPYCRARRLPRPLEAQSP